MKPKILIYDFDGVICDSVGLKTDAFVELYSSENENIQKLVKVYHLTNGGISRFEKIKYFETVLLGKIYSEEENNKLAQKFAELVKEKVINSSFIIGVKKFLEKHSKNHLQFICTGTPEFEIKEITERMGISSFFKKIYGSPKSKKEIINKILADTRSSCDECIFFGDAISDYKAANSFNIPFIGVENNNTVFPVGTKIIKNFNDPKLKIYNL